MAMGPKLLTLGLACMKIFGIGAFASLAWEWIVAPLWIALYYLDVHNDRARFGRTLWSCIAVPTAVITALLAVVLIVGGSQIGVRWWTIFTPMWTLIALHGLRSLGESLPDKYYQTSGRFWLVMAGVIVSKWVGISFTAGWSWQWISIFLALFCGLWSLVNVVAMGGGRYLVPAYVIVLVTVPAVVYRALSSTKFELTWLLILLPALAYSLFCAVVVLPNIRTLRRRVRWRNGKLEERLKRGESPAPVRLEPEIVAGNLPGADARFRLGALTILLLAAIPLHYGAGRLGGWLCYLLTSWLIHFPAVIGLAVILLFVTLYYMWVYVLVVFFVRWVASHCQCGHRPTLWTVTVIASAASFTGFVRGLYDNYIPAWSELGIVGAMFGLFVAFFLIIGQGTALGLVAALTPSKEVEQFRS